MGWIELLWVRVNLFPLLSSDTDCACCKWDTARPILRFSARQQPECRLPFRIVFERGHPLKVGADEHCLLARYEDTVHRKRAIIDPLQKRLCPNVVHVFSIWPSSAFLRGAGDYDIGCCCAFASGITVGVMKPGLDRDVVQQPGFAAPLQEETELSFLAPPTSVAGSRLPTFGKAQRDHDVQFGVDGCSM